MNIDESLKKSELFSGLSQDHRLEISHSGRETSLQKGDVIFREGDSGLSIFILLKGAIKLYRNAEDGREIIVRLLSGGELFGEVVLYQSDKFPVSAEAVEDSSIFAIPVRSIHILMEQEEFRNEFIAVLMNKQRYLSSRIHYLSAYDVEERFFKFLEENYGRREEFEISLSKKDLASAIGTIPETLSRLIGRLKKREIITWDKKKIRLKQNFWEEYDFPL